MKWWMCIKCRDLGVGGGWYQALAGPAALCPQQHGAMSGPYDNRDPRIAIRQHEHAVHERAMKNWGTAIAKARQITHGSFPGSLHMSEPYYREVLDPQHQYGPDHHALYQQWLLSGSDQSYFDWLQTQRDDQFKGVIQVKAEDRYRYRVTIVDGTIVLPPDFPKNWRNDITHGRAGDLIFVMDSADQIYVGIKVAKRFQHSSFFGGAPVKMAGIFRVDATGKILRFSNSSGHYAPGAAKLDAFRDHLRSVGVDLAQTTLQYWDGNAWAYNDRADAWMGV